MFWTQLGRLVLTIAVVGALAHFIGEALPRTWFHPKKFPYRAFAWEQNGKFYQRIGIQRWKDWMPDKSKFVKSTYAKRVGSMRSAEHMLRLVQETCVAEIVHWVLLFISPILLWTMESPGSGLCTFVYGISNLPFIAIQRYNRPRLMALYERLKQ